ncbi:HET domain-containing protein [Fusarium sp. LHS14.1]|nr:HET domain-containing protein [Fusarium sp. LHS14.1]
MRLINVRTMALEEFYGDQVPRYAILSHTWGQGEVTFQDWKAPNLASQKAGFAKILGACRQAREDSLEYLWVDTNCIDKTSSAELSEAINSMFAWYRDAVVCYAFLVDVPTIHSNGLDRDKGFRQSRWFTRGWTLQELLAPKEVIFFDQNWQKIGARSGSLAERISAITQINVNLIKDPATLIHASVAQKMSWLSRRVTTRVEDMAYCMLGIFDINMPLLYGEGRNAFLRLQEEIVKISTDHTIFCWNWVESVPGSWTSMLAPTPAAFESSGCYVEPVRDASSPELSPYSFTNAGLSIRLPLLSASGYSFALLEAHHPGYAGQSAIPLRYAVELGAFRRMPFPPGPVSVESWLSEPPRKVLVRARPGPSQWEPIFSDPSFQYGLLLTTDANVLQNLWNASIYGGSPFPTSLKGFVTTYPAGLWDDERSFIMFPTQHSVPRKVFAVMVQIRMSYEPGLVMLFAIREQEYGETLWFCKLSPESAWRDDESIAEQNLEIFEEEVSTRGAELLCSGRGNSGLHLDLIFEQNISSNTWVRYAHISMEGRLREKTPSYCVYGWDG